jgi:hypothetical protein
MKNLGLLSGVCINQDFRNSTYELDIIVIMVEIDPAACRRWSLPEDHS